MRRWRRSDARSGDDGHGAPPESRTAKTETSVKVDVKRHVGAGKVVKISGKVRPADSRWVTIRVDGKR